MTRRKVFQHFEIKVLMQDNTTYLTAKADATATKSKLQGGTWKQRTSNKIITVPCF